jgi:hypothetical protein
MLKKYYETSSKLRILADKCMLYRGNKGLFRSLVGKLKGKRKQCNLTEWGR